MFCRHHQSSGATLPRGKPHWHQTKQGTKWKARFKTHTHRPRPAVVNHMHTKALWRIKKRKRNVWAITNKHINNYGTLWDSYYTQGIVLVNVMVIITLLNHVITERKWSLFWMTMNELPCCNYCYCVTSLSDTCTTVYTEQTRNQCTVRIGQQ